MAHDAGGMEQAWLGIGGIRPPDETAMEDVESLLVASEDDDVAVLHALVGLDNLRLGDIPGGLCRELLFDGAQGTDQRVTGGQLRIEVAMGGHEVDVATLTLSAGQRGGHIGQETLLLVVGDPLTEVMLAGGIVAALALTVTEGLNEALQDGVVGVGRLIDTSQDGGAHVFDEGGAIHLLEVHHQRFLTLLDILRQGLGFQRTGHISGALFHMFVVERVVQVGEIYGTEIEVPGIGRVGEHLAAECSTMTQLAMQVICWVL